MSVHAEQLAEKRRALQLRCELQRQQLAFTSMEIEDKLRAGDRLLSLAAAAKHPAVLGAALASTMFLGPWRLFRWIGQGILIIKIVRRARELFGK
jgi:hypothetical protein